MPTSSYAHRHCVLSQLTWTECLEHFAHALSHVSNSLIVSTQSTNTLELANVEHVNFKGLNRQLGKNYDAILLDLSQGLHLSALSILAGTIKGGGLLVVHLGKNWRLQEDHELARFLPFPLESKTTPSTFKQLFWQRINSETSPFTEQWPKQLSVYEPSTQTLTSEQQSFIHSVLSEAPANHLLIAPRGRGKSFALAELISLAQTQSFNVACTASSLQNLTSLEQHFFELSSSSVPFFAPDALLEQNQSFDLLVIDEAASIPLPMLKKMCELADRVVFSSTDYGYEGSGRGFGIRFRHYLNTLNKSCYEHSMAAPLRWGENDPLENWLDALLFKEYQVTNQCPDQPKCLQGKEWLSYPSLLDQAFALLVSAHYQTSPENKRWMVDDPSVLTYCLYEQKRLVGVALVTAEGELPEQLSQAVMEGTRRPRGHLIPQSLLAHEGIQEAGQYRYWRISRIAISEDVQRQGLGSQLLNMIEHDAKQQKVDFLSASFAATVDVTHFWRQANFTGVRLGTGKDQASGAYSLMMLKGLNPASQELSKAWSQSFHRGWLETLCLNLRDLSPELILSIHSTLTMGEKPHIVKMSTKDVSDLTYFCQHHRPFDAIRPALLRLTMQRLQQGQLRSNSADDRLLLGCAINTVTERDAHKLGFSGKKAFYQQLKHIISLQLNSLENG